MVKLASNNFVTPLKQIKFQRCNPPNDYKEEIKVLEGGKKQTRKNNW